MDKQILFISTPNGTLVSSRSLCIAISDYKDPSTQYTNWIKVRLNQLVFEENKDYFKVKDNTHSPDSRALIDYLLTFDAAIKLAKKERSGWAVKAIADEQATHTPKVEEVLPEAPSESKGYTIVPESTPEPIDTKPKTKRDRLAKLFELLGEDEPEDQPQAEFEVRLVAVEQKLDTILSFFKIANQSLFGDAGVDGKLAFEIASTEALPNKLIGDDDRPKDPETTAAKVGQIVRSYGVYKNVKIGSIWRWLYKKLYAVYGFSAADNRLHEEEAYIDVVERLGQIDNLYLLASRFLVIPEPTTATA